ncbi:hypothetical protein E2C01_063871 [Portunus trituberculatus]|uniref:Uncharacterized protein n=1 Tax=Portunus trituberculatus TaxID=210409 RepID=A0A5B7HAB7_PORTR|nr:hypothetical protein [Portunus trituberculatus]
MLLMGLTAQHYAEPYRESQKSKRKTKKSITPSPWLTGDEKTGEERGARGEISPHPPHCTVSGLKLPPTTTTTTVADASRSEGRVVVVVVVIFIN